MKGSTQPTSGTYVLEGYFDKTNAAMSVGQSAEDNTAYEYNVQRDLEGEDGNTNLNNRFNITSTLNLFPAEYTVTYDANGGTAADTLPTETVLDSGKLTLKDGSDKLISDYITPPTGKVFAGWNTTAAGDGVTVDETTVINPTNVPTINTADNTLTLYATWADGYNVTFNANGGKLEDGTSTTKTFTKANGEALLETGQTIADNLLANPTKENYVFKGWYQKSGDTFTTEVTDATLQTALDKSITAYAKWEYEPSAPTTYTLNFDKNCDTATDANPTSVNYNAGDTLNSVLGGMPVEPTRSDGYKFLGWYTNQSGDGTALTADDVLATYTNNGTVTTVYAKWGYVDKPTPTDPPTPNDQTVTVKFNLGDNASYKYDPLNDKYVKYGDQITNMPLASDITAPTGKAFGGWYTKEDGAGSLVENGTTIDNNLDADPAVAAGGTLNLYPRWIDQITVTYDTNGLPAEYTAPSASTGTPGTDFTVGNIDFSGAAYELVEWNTEKNGTGTSYTKGATAQLPATDTTLYAIWNYTDTDKIPVVFNGNGTTQYASTLNPNDGTSTTDKYTMYRKAGDVITFAQMPTATRVQYTFNKWADTSNAAVEASFDNSTYTYTVTALAEGETEKNLYAIWQANPNPDNGKITVQFNANAGSDTVTISPTETVEIDLGDSLGGRIPDEPTRSKYKFDGWYTDADYTQGTKVESNTVFDTALIADLKDGDTVNLYAKWNSEVTLTFDLNGANGTAVDPITEYAGTNVTIPTPTLNADYVFKSWNTKADGTGDTVATGSYTLTENKTLYAIWDYTGADAVAVTFNSNGTTEFPATVNPDGTTAYTVNRPAGYTITTDQMPKAARDQYTFSNWDVKSNAAPGTLAAYTVPNDGTKAVTLYAIWTSNPTNADDKITISFNLNDDDSDKKATLTSPSSVVIDLGDSLGGRMADDPTRTSYEFKGWNTAADGKGTTVTDTTTFGAGKDVTAAAGDTVTLYAQWEEHVTVTFNINGGDGTTPDPIELTKGANITDTLPTTTKTNYTFKEWNTEPNGSGMTFTDANKSDANHAINESITLYAIWSYEGADAVSIVFHANDTTQKPATLAPNDGGKTYTIKVKPGDTLNFVNMPTATRTDYAFNRWGDNANDTVTADFDNSAYTITAPSAGPATVNKYAIWLADQADKHTVTFNLNPDGDANTTPQTIAPILVANNDVIGPAMPNDPTRTGYKFLGWVDVTDSDPGTFTTAFDSANTAITKDTTLKAYWLKGITLTFDANGGTVTAGSANQSLDPIALFEGQSVSDRTEAPTTLPVVEKTGYTFAGWYYEDKDGNLVKVEDTTKLSDDTTVKAKWTGTLTVSFTDKSFEYDGTGKTPLTDGNYTVKDANNNDLTTSFPVSSFTAEYKEASAADTAYGTDEPTDKGSYKIKLTMASDPAIIGTDKYTEYTLNSYDTDFTITAAAIDYTISKDYQYISEISSLENLEVKLTDSSVSPAPTLSDILTANPTDIKITFTNVDDPAKKFVNTMPDTFGKYEITIEATDTSNFEVGNITDSDSTTTKSYLYLVPTTRKIVANYGEGHVKGDAATHEADYATVTFTAPADSTDVDSVKTTLSSSGDKKVVPVEGTDFEPVSTAKTIDYWETRDSGGNQIAKFTELTDIPVSVNNEPLVIYAVYKDAQWTVKFEDTKTDPAAEATVTYTVQANMAISATDAVKMVDGVDVTDPVTDVPAPTAAPVNKTFYGWATEKITKDDLKVSDVTGSGTYANKIFTKDTAPSDVLTGDSVEVTVYAVYVLSSDATLKNVEFKKDSETGTAIGYTDTAWKPDGSIVFDPDTDTYYLVVDNDLTSLFGSLEPTQPGATIEVKVNSNTETVTQGASDTDPDTFTSSNIDETTYNKDSNTNSYNTVEVTVTAPDGTTTKTYTFNVLQYVLPEIKLNYGNSPAGLIRRDTTTFLNDSERDKAIDLFDKSDVINKKYGTDDQGKAMVPIDGNADITYTSVAWQSYNTVKAANADTEEGYVNYDLDA
ncbi:MAG: InlB B-repeat-containing protein, partial [Hominilimicola sp.]